MSTTIPSQMEQMEAQPALFPGQISRSIGDGHVHVCAVVQGWNGTTGSGGGKDMALRTWDASLAVQ